VHEYPLATYRVQLRSDFGFDQVAGIVDYLRDLGVSHLYTSPFLQAAEGSTHGYDVVDPGRVNRELGGSRGHDRLCRTLRKAGLFWMIDLVPNHMAIVGRQNPWWWDVLENGPSSPYATFFDVDWEASEERWPNKILLPVLEDHYGRVLEAGKLRLSHELGVFVLHYHDHVFPLDPSSLGELLSRAALTCGSGLLEFLAESHLRLPRPSVTARREAARRHRDKAALSLLLARLCREDDRVARSIDDEVERYNRDPDELDRLLDQQNYRLALWRTASWELGYRRFFDINDLVGLRIEEQEVFDAVHVLPLAWIEQGVVQGLRIDHPDGLRDPGEYFRRLRRACPRAWIVVEKILMPDEVLPVDWPVQGTTGYEFLHRAGGLFVDPRGEDPMTRIYREFIGENIPFPSHVRTCKELILRNVLGSELNRLTTLFVTICERHRRHRDYTRHELGEVMIETAACFPVYRTYITTTRKPVSLEDANRVSQAVDRATAERPDLDPELFAFFRDILLLRFDAPLENELAIRFQQLTAPTMAKGVEDTSLYRYHRLCCLNEVGGDPDHFGVEPESFHRACASDRSALPYSLLASSTHDTKRSEDVRSRLALLSEIPRQWEDAVSSWARRNERHRERGAVDSNTEYLLYQTLVGAWPIGEERLQAYMLKAVREAKDLTSWNRPDTAYEERLSGFIHAIMHDSGFISRLEEFLAPLILPGRINSLSLTAIKLSAPGIPDIYQGTELWDLSLVDPDNRRSVDFRVRRNLLHTLASSPVGDILEGMDSGLPKLWVISQGLGLRRDRPGCFGPQGSYAPVHATGACADHLFGFMRGGAVICLVPRLVLGLGNDWKDTLTELPAGTWFNRLSGETWPAGPISVSRILRRFPLALLENKEGGS
jgi:(1->4)-alpha-D-glucan 1-alpha-D-glucosylmutase